MTVSGVEGDKGREREAREMEFNRSSEDESGGREFSIWRGSEVDITN